MRLLVFYPYLPYPLDRGTHHRTFHLLRELARDHDVDLLALSENGEGMAHKPVFAQFCRNVHVVPFQHPPWQRLFPGRLLNRLPPNVAHWTMPRVRLDLDRVLRSEHYDAVHACDIVLAQYFLRRHRRMPLVIDRSRVDLQFQWMEHSRMNFSFKQRMLRYEGYAKLYFYERAVARRASLEVVCGADDETFVRRYISGDAPVSVIGNGVDLEYFYPGAAPDARAAHPTILFCGAMDYNPNIDALRWYFSEIHGPLRQLVPDLRVLVVGKSPIPEIQAYRELPNVFVTGGVPDVRPYYRQAWLQIVPLRIGGGTRLKIVESLAMGTAVVSTTIGAQGLGLVHNTDVLLADTAPRFVAEIARALHDRDLRKGIESAGLETVSFRFSWRMLGKQLNAAYTKLFTLRQKCGIRPVATIA